VSQYVFTLSQQQAIEHLELNLRMTKIAQANEIQFNDEVENKIVRKTADLENNIKKISIEHRALIRTSLREMT
jgi:hypothetical protein